MLEIKVFGKDVIAYNLETGERRHVARRKTLNQAEFKAMILQNSPTALNHAWEEGSPDLPTVLAETR